MAEAPDKGRCGAGKDLLGSLIASLLQDMPEDEKKKLLHSVMRGDGEHRETIEMVEH
jgi:hypothetical protein